MFFKILLVITTILSLSEVKCQLGQFGFPFFNNVQQNAQSSFNPQQRQTFTFGSDSFNFPNPFENPWTPPPRPNNNRPQQNNRPFNNQNQNQYRPPPAPTTTLRPTTTTRRVSVLQANRVGGRISQTSKKVYCCSNIFQVIKRIFFVSECEEYSKLIKKTFQVTSLSLDTESQNVEVSKCDYASTGLIVGGQDAVKGEFPHVAASEFIKFRIKMNET